MQYSFILLSAGKGTRFGKNIPKQYLPFAGKPMVVHTLERVEKIPEIKEIILVCNKEYIERIEGYLLSYRITKKVVFVQGGATRQESVYNGLLKCSYDNIVIHEAARPLVTERDYRNLIQCEKENVSYTYAIPYTVLKKDFNDNISGILKREELVNIQLPQKFNKKDLLVAHERAIQEGISFTEDASAVYYIGKSVYCLQGKSYNIKMTEYIDLLYGEMLISEGIFKEND